jgi:tetratricopeptide (TPR) repeat protein
MKNGQPPQPAGERPRPQQRLNDAKAVERARLIKAGAWPPPKRLKDVDAVERARLVKAGVWLAPASLVFFGMLTAAASRIWGFGPLGALLVGLFLGLLGPWIAYGLIYKYVIGGTATLLGRLYYSDESTPQAPTSWRAQALSARGSHAEALKALEEEAAEYPDDPGPCMRAAALCLQELDDPESAVRFFLQARRAQATTPETDAYISVRLADVYESLGEAGQAMTEMSRLLKLHPDSQHAPGARARLAALKRAQAGEQNPAEGG